MIEPARKYKSASMTSAYLAAKKLAFCFTIVELMAVILVFGLSAAAVALRFSKSTDTEHLDKCQRKLDNVLKTACSQARVYHSPVKLTYDLKKRKVTAEQISQFNPGKNISVEFSLDKGIYIEQFYRSKDDCVFDASVNLLIQPAGWLNSHAVVIQNLQGRKVLFWNSRGNCLIEFKRVAEIPWEGD